MPGIIRLTRIPPKLGPQAYKSYGLRRPLESHWRVATCEEYGCEAYRCGWVTTVDTSDDLGKARHYYISHDRSRRHSVQHVGGSLYKFVFGPGQACYRASEHRTRIDRAPLLVVADGDWRGNPRNTPVRVHRTVDDWVDDFSTHQERLARAAS